MGTFFSRITSSPSPNKSRIHSHDKVALELKVRLRESEEFLSRIEERLRQLSADHPNIQLADKLSQAYLIRKSQLLKISHELARTLAVLEESTVESDVLVSLIESRAAIRELWPRMQGHGGTKEKRASVARRSVAELEEELERMRKDEGRDGDELQGWVVI